MRFTMLSRRVAATGAVTAIAAATLVGVATAPAHAASATGDYACSAPGLGELGTFPMTFDAPILDNFPTIAAGFPVGAGLVETSSSMGVPAGVAGLLDMAGVTGGTIDDFAITIGDTVATAPQTVTEIAPGEAGAKVVHTTGSNLPFVMPEAGSYDILMPESFTFAPTTAGGPLGIAITCVTEAPASMGTIETTLNESTTDLTGTRATVRRGKAAKVVASVLGNFAVATGDVVAKKGKREIGRGNLEDGMTTFRLDKLKPGVYTIKVKYLGDGFYNPSQTSYRLTVKR